MTPEEREGLEETELRPGDPDAVEKLAERLAFRDTRCGDTGSKVDRREPGGRYPDARIGWWTGDAAFLLGGVSGMVL
ncbi:hypothetical protein [Kitasatospora aureofaciens]|uniref:hypothetical protein n=1 Tax=Kitasatospora aureofaciens TaxID=1894 RepID=UPI000B0BA1A3|nr:hypothetical protein [Kitasatospora aureofaciens]